MKKNIIGNIAKYGILSIFAVVFLVPLYYAIVNSFAPLFSSSVVIPTEFTLINYKYATTLIPFFRYLRNSVIIVAISMGTGLTLDFVYAYALSRLNVRGRDLIFKITLAQMMIPGFAVSIPQYLVFSFLGIKNTFWIYFITALPGGAATIFLYRQYFLNIPYSIEEAAVIDGCGGFDIIFKIFLPMCKPIIAVSAFTAFTGAWGDYMTPYMYLSEKLYPLAYALFGAKFTLPSDPNTKLNTVVYAAALLFAIPVFVVFFICQKHLVSGVTAGSVKG